MLIIDNPYRELWGISAVCAVLRRQGISSVIVSKTNYELCWERYRPVAVVLPRVTHAMAGFVRRVADRSWIFLIPAEHGQGFKDKVVLNIAARHPDGKSIADSAIDDVDMAFLGGRNQYEWLRDKKILDEGHMQITGTLNSDQWCLRRFERPLSRTGLRFGIATTNKSILFGSSIRSVVGLLDTHRPGNWEEDLWRVDFSAFEMAHMLLLTQVIERLRRTKWEASLRPHPHEHMLQWQEYVRTLGSGIELNRALRIDEWLDTVSVVLASFSTAAVDAIAHGIPALSLHALLPNRIFDALPDLKKPFLSSFVWTPRSLDEFFDLIEKARSGSLAPSPQPELAKKFMADNFNFPREYFACEAIAQTIHKMIEYDKRSTRRGHVVGEGSITYIRPLSRKLCRIPVVRSFYIMYVYVKIFLTSARRENLYFPFSAKQRHDARGYVKRILKRIEDRSNPREAP